MGRKLSIYLVGVCAALIGGRSVGGIGSYSSAGPGGIRALRSRWHRSGWQVAETRSRDPSCSFSATGQVLPTDGLSQRWVCSTYILSHCSAQCVHWTVFFPFDRERLDTLSNLETVILLNIYLSQRTRSKGTMRKLDFREPQTLNL